MEAILKYNLDDLDDARNFEVCIKGRDYLSILWEFDQYLRSELKYKELPDEVYDALQKVREKLHEIKDAHGVSIDI